MSPCSKARPTAPTRIRPLAGLVNARPVLVIVTVLVLTAVLGGLASQAVVVDAGAVENETTEVLAEIDEQFGGDQSVLQILVGDADDIRSAAGLRAATTIRDAIGASGLASTLASPDAHEPIIGFLDAAADAAAAAGQDPATLSDAEVVDWHEHARAQAGAEDQRLVDALLADRSVPNSGLILVFQDTAGLTSDEVAAQQQQLADVVRGTSLPAGLTAEPFSMELLLADQELGAEVGRLLGTALVIIALVLGVVYWTGPGAGRRLLIGRRTAADVALTLGVVLLAVVWMQGAGVLLGPGYLDWIGPFSPETDIVPILLVGLGVDFGIHLLARYRDELGAGYDPATAHRRATSTIGVSLAVAAAATAVGFATNQASPVEFLRTLGVLAAVGVLAALLLTLTFLPAVRVLLDRRAERSGRLPETRLARQSQRLLPRAAGRAVWLAERAPMTTVLVALLLAIAGGYGFTKLDTRFAITDMVPRDAPQLSALEKLESDFGGGLAETTEVLLVGELTTARAEAALAESVTRALALEPVELLPRAPEVLPGEGNASVGRVTLITSAGMAGAGDLVVDLQAAFDPLREVGVEVSPGSMEIAQAEMTEAIREAQARSLAIALLAAASLVALYFWWAQRRPLLGLVVLAPAGTVLAWTFGMMALTDLPLNPVTATLAALSIGIAVPFTVHVTSRFIEERQRHEPLVALRLTMERTGGALAGSALTTAVGFGVLLTSTLLPFQQLGFILVYVIGCSLVVSLLVLPSLLLLWEKWGRGGDQSRSRRRYASATAPARSRTPSLS